MRAYGLPRVPEVESPDKADIIRFGLSTTDRCSRRTSRKRAARRLWKKAARRQNRNEIRIAQED